MSAIESNRRFVYQWFDYGFFSEVNYMLLAILYCRLHKKQFVLSSKYATVFHTKGWRDFFEPFCPETDSRILHFLDTRPLPPLGGLKSRLSGLDKGLRRRLLTQVIRPLFYPNVEVVSDNWEALRRLREEETFVSSVDDVQHHGSLREALSAINRRVWHYNAETASAINTSIAGLALPERYAALHIRRGDMCGEVEPIDESRYVDRLERATLLQDVYVATDDYRCVEIIQRLRPWWRVSFLCPTTMRGYFPEDFDHQPSEERGRRSLLLLTETEVMRSAEVFVGTFSSGIGTYQGIARDRYTYGVDSEDWRFEGESEPSAG